MRLHKGPFLKRHCPPGRKTPELRNWMLLGGDSLGDEWSRLAQSASSPLYIMSFSGNLTDR